MNVRFTALLRASWRKPLCTSLSLLLLNALVVALILPWGFFGKATASSDSPTPLPKAALEKLRLNVKKIDFESTLDGQQLIFTFANRLPEGFGENSYLPNDFQFSDQNAGRLTLSFSGHVQNLPKPIIRAFKTPNLEQVYIESHLGKVQVFMKRAHPKTSRLVWDQAHNRLYLRIQNYSGRMLKYETPYKGLVHREVLQNTSYGPLRIHVLEVDPKHLEVMPVLAQGRMGAKASVRDMVQDVQGIAGINASFFKQDAGVPIGTVILDDELVSGPLFQRVCLGIDRNNQAHLAKLTLHGNIRIPVISPAVPPLQTGLATTTQQLQTVTLPIENVNQPRIRANQTVIYTDRWGPRAPGVPSNGIQVLLMQGHVQQVSSSQPLAIPKGGLVVSGPMTQAMGLLATLPPELTAETTFYTKPDWSNMKHAISGGPYLVHNGQRYIDLQAQQFRRGLGNFEPRSALGILPNGRLLLVTIDGRVSQSVGARLSELSQLMQELGAVEAMNLDGGSSTQMVLGSRTVTATASARVSTALVVRPLGTAVPIAAKPADNPSVTAPLPSLSTDRTAAQAQGAPVPLHRVSALDNTANF